MISPVNPVSGEHVTIEELEKRLVAMKCEKVGTESTYVCVWRAPNGRHFTAPNPATMYLIPTSQEARLMDILANLARLPPIDGDSEMPGIPVI